MARRYGRWCRRTASPAQPAVAIAAEHQKARTRRLGLTAEAPHPAPRPPGRSRACLAAMPCSAEILRPAASSDRRIGSGISEPSRVRPRRRAASSGSAGRQRMGGGGAAIPADDDLRASDRRPAWPAPAGRGRVPLVRVSMKAPLISGPPSVVAGPKTRSRRAWRPRQCRWTKPPWHSRKEQVRLRPRDRRARPSRRRRLSRRLRDWRARPLRGFARCSSALVDDLLHDIRRDRHADERHRLARIGSRRTAPGHGRRRAAPRQRRRPAPPGPSSAPGHRHQNFLERHGRSPCDDASACGVQSSSPSATASSASMLRITT